MSNKNEKKVYGNIYLKNKSTGEKIKVSSLGADIMKKYRNFMLDLYEARKDESGLIAVWLEVRESDAEDEPSISFDDIA